jgi:hypothetical protein
LEGVTGYLTEALADKPRVARLFTARLRLSRDRAFEFGLDCLLDGIAARIAAQSRG